MMWILNFFGALVTLMIGALILNFVSQGLEGRKTYFLHFGFVAMIVVIGAVAFPLWSWVSTAWILSIATLLSISPPLWERLMGNKPQGYMWHGDDPESHDEITDPESKDPESKNNSKES